MRHTRRDANTRSRCCICRTDRHSRHAQRTNKKKLSLTNASTINIARYATATQRTVPRATRAQHTDSVRRRSALGTAVSGKWYIRAQSGNERTRDAHTTSSYLICVQLTRESCVERTRSPKNCARLAGVRVRVVRVRPPLIVFVL